jgi:hypothetical protein
VCVCDNSRRSGVKKCSDHVDDAHAGNDVDNDGEREDAHGNPEVAGTLLNWFLL